MQPVDVPVEGKRFAIKIGFGNRRITVTADVESIVGRNGYVLGIRTVIGQWDNRLFLSYIQTYCMG